MLSQSDIFNRLPISNEQKAQLYDALLQEQRDQTKEPNMVPCEFPKVTNMSPCEIPEILNWDIGPDSLNDEPHTEPEYPGNSSQTPVEQVDHSQVGSLERDLAKETESAERR